MTRRAANKTAARVKKPAQNAPESVKEATPQPPAKEEPPAESSSTSSRPRRTVKKNSLYHNADYDLDLAARGNLSVTALEKQARASTPKAPKSRAKSKPAVARVVEPEPEPEAEQEPEPEQEPEQDDEMVPATEQGSSGPAVSERVSPHLASPVQEMKEDSPERQEKPPPVSRSTRRGARVVEAEPETSETPAETMSTIEQAQPPAVRHNTRRARAVEAVPAQPALEAPLPAAEDSAETMEDGPSSPIQQAQSPAVRHNNRKARAVEAAPAQLALEVPPQKQEAQPEEEGERPLSPMEQEPASVSELPQSSGAARQLRIAAARRPVNPAAPKRAVPQRETSRAAKKRKVPESAVAKEEFEQLEPVEDVAPAGEPNPKQECSTALDDIVYADGADLVVGCDVEVVQEDDGPPVLGPSQPYTEEVVNEEEDMESDEDDEESPPNLEKQQSNKKRGRPRLPKGLKETPSKMKLKTPNNRIIRNCMTGDRAKAFATANQRIVKLFESDISVTPEGDSYATVISGCLAEILRKERIIDFLSNPEEAESIRQGGWMLDHPPRLPPLTPAKICFAFYVDGSKVTNPKDLSIDDLRPWSSSFEGIPTHGSIKPNVRRHPVARQNGKLMPCKVDPRLAELYLTEYSARLPRDQRLRKKIFYLSRENAIFGNVLILYDYTMPGVVPQVLSAPHGNDLLFTAASSDMVGIRDNGSPFEPMLHEGHRGGIYLKVKPHKLGWVHNKAGLLDAIYNKQDIVENLGALNDCLPFLPPLTEGTAVFVYFVPGSGIINQIHHATDGFSPWTTNPSHNAEGLTQPRVRSSRRPLEHAADGRMVICRDPRAQTMSCLVETMSTLARCKRIRKRVIYIQQSNGMIQGNVCYIYEYLSDGPIPELMNNVDTKIYNKWSPRPIEKKRPVGAVQEQLMPQEHLYDDEIGMEIVEEVITPGMEEDEEEIIDPQGGELIEGMEDTLNDGFDDEFPDDLDKSDNPAPFYDHIRQLQTGHVYLTVRHKKMAATFDTVLEWIANSDVVEERGLLNEHKPGHPPIVTNARAYAFFVAGSAIFPHDINRDDFSPWSHNGSPGNPTCYRTKVRKIGVGNDVHSNTFVIRDSNYKSCPFHLVFLYSINPRDPRLRKKIFYLMETASKMVICPALIIYDYNSEGQLPRLNTGHFKSFAKKNFTRANITSHDVYNDVSDISEEEKECPFVTPAEEAPDGTMYLEVTDQDFWNDRNRQLQFMVNRPQLVASMCCVNNKVPDAPPMSKQKGAFVFFVNGDEINFRQLTQDRLAPWSDNNSKGYATQMKRPKSSKIPLALNRVNQLRVWKANNIQNTNVEYQMHVYTAILPRLPRLRKKVTYVLKEGRQIGYAMIMYYYTESGDLPQLLEKNYDSDYLDRFAPDIKMEILESLKTMEPAEVAKMMFETRGQVVNPHHLHYIHREERNTHVPEIEFRGASDDLTWSNADGAGPSTSGIQSSTGLGEAMNIGGIVMNDMVADGAMVVEHTEIIEQTPMEETMDTMEPVMEQTVMEHSDAQRDNFIKNSPTGFIRGHQRYDAMWRICQKAFGTSNGHETFDQLFRLLLERNENRLLQMVNHTFKVEIYPTEVIGEEIVEEVVEEVVEEGVEEEVIEEVVEEVLEPQEA